VFKVKSLSYLNRITDTPHAVPQRQQDGKLMTRAMDSAGSIHSETLPRPLFRPERHFEISLYFLLLTGVVTLVSTGKLDLLFDFSAPGRAVVQGLPLVPREGAEI